MGQQRQHLRVEPPTLIEIPQAQFKSDPGSTSAFQTLVAPIVAGLEAHYPEVAVAELLKLYRTRWHVETVYAARAINAVSARRGAVSEILVGVSS